jgi:hypothetical protein
MHSSLILHILYTHTLMRKEHWLLVKVYLALAVLALALATLLWAIHASI